MIGISCAFRFAKQSLQLRGHKLFSFEGRLGEVFCFVEDISFEFVFCFVENTSFSFSSYWKQEPWFSIFFLGKFWWLRILKAFSVSCDSVYVLQRVSRFSWSWHTGVRLMPYLWDFIHGFVPCDSCRYSSFLSHCRQPKNHRSHFKETKK